jgi:hypothetical protein
VLNNSGAVQSASLLYQAGEQTVLTMSVISGDVLKLRGAADQVPPLHCYTNLSGIPLKSWLKSYRHVCLLQRIIFVKLTPLFGQSFVARLDITGHNANKVLVRGYNQNIPD